MKQEYFEVLNIHRDDLKPYLKKKKRESLTDEQMKRLARKLGELLMNDWPEALEVLCQSDYL
jgi:hypothetical protein